MAISIRQGRMSRQTLYSATLKDEGGMKAARCPELDLTGRGKTRDEALDALREAIQGYLESFGAPKSHRNPKSIVLKVLD